MLQAQVNKSDDTFSVKTSLPDITPWTSNFKQVNSLKTPRSIKIGTNIKTESILIPQMINSSIIAGRNNRINHILKDNVIQNLVTNDSVVALLEPPREDNFSCHLSKMAFQKQTRIDLDQSRHAYKQLNREFIKNNLNDQHSITSLENAKNKLTCYIELYKSAIIQVETSLTTLHQNNTCRNSNTTNRNSWSGSDPIRLFSRFPDILNPLIKTQQFVTDNQHRYKYRTV